MSATFQFPRGQPLMLEVTEDEDTDMELSEINTTIQKPFYDPSLDSLSLLALTCGFVG
jgi:hypothetical protein